MAFTDGSTALAEMTRGMPDLLITDWQMPVMNGAEFLKRAYLLFDMSNTTALVVSSDDVLRLRRSGLVPYEVEILHKVNPFERISEITQRIFRKINGNLL